MNPATSRHLRSAGASISLSISAALSGRASVGKPAAGIAIYQLPEANALEAGIVVDDAIVTFEQKAARILPAGIGYESTARHIRRSASAHRSLGIAVFSGMLASTCIAVEFIPSFYVQLQRLCERHAARKTPPDA